MPLIAGFKDAFTLFALIHSHFSEYPIVSNGC